MKRKTLSAVLGLALVLGALLVVPRGAAGAQGPEPQGIAGIQAALGTAFTYQGYLTDSSGRPIDGTCNITFRLYDQAGSGCPPTGGTDLGGGTLPVTVENGYFTQQLDFGVFTGEARWLEIAVDCGSGSSTLCPRQSLTSVPYAIALRGLWTQPNGTCPNIIGGHSGNSVTDGVVGATISGGGYSVGGAIFINEVTADYGTIGGGVHNTASGYAATVGGGRLNVASSDYATIGGGYNNRASDLFATVGGGWVNWASGYAATVPGGRMNTAQGDYSFAAGRRAKANHQGAFVWADANDFDFDSAANNEFAVRATGGVSLVLAIDVGGDPTWTCSVSSGGSWSCSSDRDFKENLVTVDGQQILERLSRVPIYTWNAKVQDPATQHIGPMAQDFYAAFGVGEDDRHIATIDLDGVALSAIQGLHQVVQEQSVRVKTLEAENIALQKRLDDLETRVAALERKQGTAVGGIGGWFLPGLLASGFLVGLVVVGRSGVLRQLSGGGR